MSSEPFLAPSSPYREPENPLQVASLGGGHGLFQTLTAARSLESADITAIVTVADDGGSSGRLRRELDIIPPGDLRMAIAALAGSSPRAQKWAKLLQHRFRGNGALAGHAVGNLILAGLDDVLGDHQSALDMVTELTEAQGRVLPVVCEPLDIEADVAGLDDDPRVMRVVRGQVAVATTPGSVRRVRLIPESPEANPLAVEAIRNADVVTLGPGSWFSSVIPHLLLPEIVEAITSTQALRIAFINLSAEAGETSGFTTERHLHVLRQHAPTLQLDKVLVDSHNVTTDRERRFITEAANSLGAEPVFADLASLGKDDRRKPLHDPAKMTATIRTLLAER